MVWGNRKFTGIFPKVSPRLLSEEAAQVAQNCWLDRGHPRPIPQPRRVSGVPQFGAIVKSIYRFDGTGPSNDRWFAWNTEVDVVRAPVVEDTTRRTIWTGDDYPRHTSTRIMQGSGFNSPGIPISRRLGIPAPTSAPSVALGTLTTDPAPDPDDPDATPTPAQPAEFHAYVFTWLSDLDEEGPPSPASTLLTRRFNSDGSIQSVTLTLPTSLTGAFGANRKRIYRTATGASGTTTYQLCLLYTSQSPRDRQKSRMPSSA